MSNVISERVSGAAAGSGETEDTLGALKGIAEAGSLFTGLSFIGGWSYMASYYMSFGVNPFELDVSVPFAAAFAVHMLLNSMWPLLLAGILFAAIALLYPRLAARRRAWAGLAVAIVLFAVAIAGSLRGRQLAREDMFDTSPRLPSVGFVSKSKVTEPKCLTEGTEDCKLLLHAKGAYYFFEPIPASDSQSVHGLNLRVFIVPDTEISATYLERGVE
jgi:hypothetical protein